MTRLSRCSDIGSVNISTPVIIIGLVGRSMRSQAVSTRDIGSRRSALRGFLVAIRISRQVERVNHAAVGTVNLATGASRERTWARWGFTGKAFEPCPTPTIRSEDTTSALQSIMRHTYDVFCLKIKHTNTNK